MTFGDYLLGALLYTALFVIIPAITTLRVAWGHYNDSQLSRHKVEAAWAAVLVSLGVVAHALSELFYKSSRLLQIKTGTHVNADGTLPEKIIYGMGIDLNIILNFGLTTAALLGITSLSFAVHYLNQKRTWYKHLYWSGHALFFSYFLLT